MTFRPGNFNRNRDASSGPRSFGMITSVSSNRIRAGPLRLQLSARCRLHGSPQTILSLAPRRSLHFSLETGRLASWPEHKKTSPSTAKKMQTKTNTMNCSFLESALCEELYGRVVSAIFLLSCPFALELSCPRGPEQGIVRMVARRSASRIP